MNAVAACVAGLISPEVAVARMVLGGADAAAILAALDGTPGGTAAAAMRALVTARAAALDGLAAEVAATAAGHDASGPTAADGVARIAAFFDRAVRHSPEASVALYSLGDPAILAAATEEIVGWLEAGGWLSPGADVLDIGCGIGRVAAALAPRCRSVLGLDVSAGMVAEARRRLAPFPNVVIQQTNGLSPLPPRAEPGVDSDFAESADLVLAIDSFPYIVQTGPDTARRHFTGAATLLRPGGVFCILNFSYRADPAIDRADTADYAATAGLHVIVDGERPFALWDGVAFVMQRRALCATVPHLNRSSR